MLCAPPHHTEQMRESESTMFRSAVGKVVWMARATTVVVGLAIMMGLVFGMASVALGTDGQRFIIGALNTAESISTLEKSGKGPALSLKVDSGPPLAVNKQAKVANLNADKLDGKHAGAFLPKATYRKFDGTPGTNLEGSSNTFLANISCDEGDVLLSGGYGSIDAGTTVVSSQPVDTKQWELVWIDDSPPDNVVVTIYCADFGRPHTP